MYETMFLIDGGDKHRLLGFGQDFDLCECVCGSSIIAITLSIELAAYNLWHTYIHM